MNIEIKQAPFNTSLMGVIRGVTDYMGIDLSTPSLYGRSGHAFMLNIHEAICPSGPYCWNTDSFIKLLGNCGVEMKKHGFFSVDSTLEEKTSLENTIKQELEKGNPCCVVNLDYQLITGFDSTGFICSQPWALDYPPSHLSFGSWDEWKDEVHSCFYSFEKIAISNPIDSVLQSLQFAMELNESPCKHTVSPYTCGIDAYGVWIKGIENGYGAEYGNWWNGTVWSECRKQGALFFGEIAVQFPSSAVVALKLQDLLDLTAGLLQKVSDKELTDRGKKIGMLLEAEQHEKDALTLIRDLFLSLSEGKQK